MTHGLGRERGASNAAQISYPGIFWESQSCLITTYSARTAVGVISCICVSYFLLRTFFSSLPPFFFSCKWQTSTVEKTRLISTLPSAKYFSCNSRQKRSPTPEPEQPRSSRVTPAERTALPRRDEPRRSVGHQENSKSFPR